MKSVWFDRRLTDIATRGRTHGPQSRDLMRLTDVNVHVYSIFHFDFQRGSRIVLVVMFLLLDFGGCWRRRFSQVSDISFVCASKLSTSAFEFLHTLVTRVRSAFEQNYRWWKVSKPCLDVRKHCTEMINILHLLIAWSSLNNRRQRVTLRALSNCIQFYLFVKRSIKAVPQKWDNSCRTAFASDCFPICLCHVCSRQQLWLMPWLRNLHETITEFCLTQSKPGECQFLPISLLFTFLWSQHYMASEFA